MRCTKTDCFAHNKGKCDALTEVIEPCSFYKTDGHVTNGVRYGFRVKGGYTPKVTTNGKKIKYWRRLNGYSQEQFAELIGVPKSTVVYWETGAKDIPGDWVQVLMDLGVEVEE